MLNPALQIETPQDANTISKLLEQAETALAINDYDKAILLLVRIAELKEKQKESSIELADAYYDVGDAYYNGAAQSFDKSKADEYLLKSLHYLQLAKVHYPPRYIDDISACTKLISEIIANNEHLAMRAIKAPKAQLPPRDIDLLAHSSEALSRSDDKANEQEKPKVKSREESKAKEKKKYKVTPKSRTPRFKHRAALAEGKLIKSLKIKKMYLTFKLHSAWVDKSHSRGIKKMFNEIAKTRPLFREHLQLVRGNDLKFLIIKPFDNATPESILDFICEQAKRDSSSFLVKLKDNALISYVEVEGKFAVFHIIDEHQTPEDLFKINSALYNRYISDKVFRKHFGAPTKNDRMPRMEIKQPFQGLSAAQILNNLIAILNKKAASDLTFETDREQSLESLSPMISSTSDTSFLPTSAPITELELESPLFQTSLMLSEPEYNQDDFASLFSEQGFVQPPLIYQYDAKFNPSAGDFVEADDDYNLQGDWGFRI